MLPIDAPLSPVCSLIKLQNTIFLLPISGRMPHSHFIAPWRGRLAEGGIYARIGLPILFTQLCMMANGVIDTLMAGHADRFELGGYVRNTGLDAGQELAGVAIGNGIWVSLMMFILGFIFATTPMVAELFGAEKMTGIGRLIRRLFWPALLLGLILSALGWLAGVLIEPWMQEGTGDIAAGYLRIVAFGGVPLALGTLLRCYSEGMTLTRPITIISLIGVVINIPLNAVLIYGLAGMEPMGGRGCALATALVNWIGLAITLGYVYFAAPYRETKLFSGRMAYLHLPTIIKQFRIGTPIAVIMLIELSMFPGMALLIAIRQLPDASVAGHQIAMTTAGVFYMFPLAVAITATVRMGNLLGAHHYQSLNRASHFPLYLACIIATGNALLLLLFRDSIAGLYSRMPEVVSVGGHLLLYAMLFQWFDGLQGTAIGVLRGFSNTLLPMVWIAFSYWVVGMPVAWMAAFQGFAGMQPMGIDGLWFGMTIGLLVAAITLISYQLWFVPRFSRRVQKETLSPQVTSVA